MLAVMPRMGIPSLRAILADRDTDAKFLGLHEACTSSDGWSRNISWLAAHSKLVGVSLMSLKPPATITLTFPDSRISQAISMDCRAIAPQKLTNSCWILVRSVHTPGTNGDPDQASGDRRNKLTYPAVVLKLSARGQ